MHSVVAAARGQLRERLYSVAAVDAHVTLREPGEYHVAARKQLRHDVREQEVAKVVAIEGAEHHDRIMLACVLHHDSRTARSVSCLCAPGKPTYATFLHSRGSLADRRMIYNVVSGKLIRKDQAGALVNGGNREMFSILA